LGGLEPLEVPVTGQTVVYKGIVSVTTLPTGQLGTEGGHLVMVWTVVVNTVEVVNSVTEADKVTEG
jgi:hypothetical protein